ncbi:hypothetical protein O3P69_010055 [Scylla paramamosain]|uniref:Uncharacterized protein n=1 Tax=Scylla paramamosain TaxID=85552 RepID=A0AAW0SPK8_SCYPA
MVKVSTSCLPNEYQCGVTCIDLGRRCDTRPDCPDGEDEEDCETYECPVTHFKCDNHFCVPSELVCDFDDHCGDGSDEHQCRHRDPTGDYYVPGTPSDDGWVALCTPGERGEEEMPLKSIQEDYFKIPLECCCRRLR